MSKESFSRKIVENITRKATLFPHTSKSKGISCDLDIEEIVEKCGKLNRY